jgi:hypothetical protein
LSNSEEFAIVSPYELVESDKIPVFAGVDKIQVIPCHLYFGLCRGCHIVVQVA